MSQLVPYWTVALLLISALTLADAKVALKVRKMEMCADHPVLPHTYSDLTIEMDPETEILYISGVLNASEPLEEGTTGKVQILKCLNDDEKSCEKYLSLEIDDFCVHLPDSDKPWSPIISGLDMEPQCPVPPGIYQLQDAAMAPEDMGDQEEMVGHWQARMVVEYRGKLMSCLQGDALIAKVRE